jgi:hypothetical protein
MEILISGNYTALLNVINPEEFCPYHWLICWSLVLSRDLIESVGYRIHVQQEYISFVTE